jgi:hypothetical protein
MNSEQIADFLFSIRKNSIDNPHALAIHLAGFGVINATAVNFMIDHINENRLYFSIIGME